MGQVTHTVINRHHFKGKTIPKPWRYIGRGTPLGNPFTRAEHGEDALTMYKRWLWGKMVANDERVMRELRSISEDENLVCSCKPRPCHGDVVVAAWEWMKRDDGKRNHR